MRYGRGGVSDRACFNIVRRRSSCLQPAPAWRAARGRGAVRVNAFMAGIGLSYNQASIFKPGAAGFFHGCSAMIEKILSWRLGIRLGRQRTGEGKARRLGQRGQLAAAFFGQADATDDLASLIFFTKALAS